MNDADMNITIAKAIGWKQSGHFWKPPKWKRGIPLRMLPAFPSSLDDMHDAVASLSERQQHTYAVVLATNKWPGMRTWNDWRDTLAVSEATARERAEAFLIALNP